VAYFGIPITGVDYTNFSLAYNAANAGDTIYVFPGVQGIEQTITKKIILIGPGDFLDSTATPKGNAYLQVNTGVVTVSSISFNAGSDGSVIAGFEGGTYYVSASNITITRNRDANIYLSSPAATYSNLQITQNYKVNISATSVNGSNISNMLVSNNLIATFYTPIGNNYTGNISNNVWAYDNTAGNTNGGSETMSNGNNIELGNGQYLLENNIFENYTNTNVANNYLYFVFNDGGNSVFNYNLALQTATPINWGSGTGNVITPIANVAKIFAAFPVIGTSSADARYMLAAGSPASTIGAGGKPIGMFAGNNPYKLSLIPAIPTIYKLGSPQGNNPSGSTITINLSTRANN
jgi:hypothetical protein